MEEKKRNLRYGANLKIGGRLYNPAQVESMRDYMAMQQAPLNLTVEIKTEPAPVNEEKKTSGLHRDRLLNDQADIPRKPYHAARKMVKDRGYHMNNGNTDIPERIKNGLENSLESQNSLGTQVLSESIETAEKSVKVFKCAQKATPHVVNVTLKIKKTSVNTTKVLTGQISLDKAGLYIAGRISNSSPVRYVKNTAQTIKTTATTTRYYLVKGKSGLQRVVVLTKGIALGTVKISVSRSDLVKLKKYTGSVLRKGVKTGKKVAASTAEYSMAAGRGLDRGVLGAGDLLFRSDDTGVQVTGYTLTTVHYAGAGIAKVPGVLRGTYKTVKNGLDTGRRAVVKTGRGARNTYRNVKTGISTIRQYGVRPAVRMYKDKWKKTVPKKVKKKLARAARGTVSVIADIARGTVMKVILPLLIILVIILVVVQAVSTSVMAFASLFFPTLSGDNGEIDEIAWIQNKITLKRTGLIKEVKETYYGSLVEYGGEYHYIRFFNDLNDAEIELTDTNIFTSIYSVSEYQDYIQPIFHTLILSEYGLEASETQMDTALDMIWKNLSRIKTEELPVEYCYAGSTEPDGNIHADVLNCPNASGIQYHDDDSLPFCSCDYHYFDCDGHEGSLDCGKEEHSHTYSCYDNFYYCYTCGEEGNCNKTGHDVRPERVLDCDKQEHTHNEWKSPEDSGCHETNYHEGRLTSDCGNSTGHKGCRGFSVCNGHKILALSVELNSFSDLLDKYYLSEINKLEAKVELNTEEKNRLRELQDNYEICINYMEILETEFGLGGGTIVDLEGITLTEITDFACQFIGNPYVWGGNDPHTGADCSGFVKYVYGNFGVNLPRVAHEQVSSGVMVSSISEAKEGDLIYWSDTGTDNGVYHVAIYLGNGKIIHASNSKPYPQGGIKVSNLYGRIYKIKRVVG